MGEYCPCLDDACLAFAYARAVVVASVPTPYEGRNLHGLE